MRTAEETRLAADQAEVIRLPVRRVTSMTLEQLLVADLPEPSFVIPGLIQKGLTILAGRPKLGKSWLMLDWALAATTSRMALGCHDSAKGDVLLLALEDNFTRLKSRLRMLGAKPSCQLEIHTEWPRGKEAVEGIARWHDKHQATGRMVFVDRPRLGRVAKPFRRGADPAFRSLYAGCGDSQGCPTVAWAGSARPI